MEKTCIGAKLICEFVLSVDTYGKVHRTKMIAEEQIQKKVDFLNELKSQFF
jgi:hypothetical protein